MLKKSLLRAKFRSFTLIELMVVVAIIMLLAGVVVVNADQARKKSRDAKRIADINTVATALQAYYTDHHSYPGGNLLAGYGSEGGTVLGLFPASKCVYVDILDPRQLGGGIYLNSCPQDPKAGISGCQQYGYSSADYAVCGWTNYSRSSSYIIDNNTTDPWGYRYTCWGSNGVCTHYALAATVELAASATLNPDPNTPGYASYRLCDGEPDSGNSCLTH